jgi:hypothetical protein
MMLKASQPKSALIREGEHPAVVSSVKGLPNQQDPKKVGIGFHPEGHDTEVIKEIPLSFEEGMPLRTDYETILGRHLTIKEAAAGVDASQLIGKKCRVVVMHKSGSGGKPKAVVGVVLAASEAGQG